MGRWLRLLVAVPILVVLVESAAHAQYALRTASGGGGIIGRVGRGGAFNYDVSKSRLGLKLTILTDQPTGIDSNGNPVTLPDSELTIDFGLAATDGRRDLFQGGEFEPAADGALTYHWTWEGNRPANAGFFGRPAYVTLFTRASGSLREVEITQELPSAIAASQRNAADLGGGVGLNIGFSEDVALSVLARAGYAWNSVAALKERRACTLEASGVNSSGATVTLADCSDRFFGEPNSGASGQVRMDFTTKVLALGDAEEATLGLLASASANLESGKKTAYDFALGPTVHPAGFPAQVRLAVLGEVVDATDARGARPSFEDRFRVRLYLSVPFDALDF